MAQNKPRCVLVTRFSALGDVMMALPVLYDTCRAHPDVHFVFASRKWAVSLAQCPPPNLTVEPVDLKGDYSGVGGMLRLARELRRKYDVDTMADLHSVLRTWVLGAALRLRGVTVRRIDKGRRDKRALIAGRSTQPLLHTTQRYRKVFAELGLDSQPAFTSLFDHDLPPCSLAGEKPDGHRWIALAPFAAHEGKVYPLEQMLQVVRQLADDPQTHIFLLGGGDSEKEILASWAKDHDNVTSVAAIDHTFADELALVARCDAMVSMDSANMHLASLVDVPVVSVWGATHPDCGFMGYRQSVDNAVQLPLDCRPCSVFGNKPCRLGDRRCLMGITPEMIVDKVNQLTRH